MGIPRGVLTKLDRAKRHIADLEGQLGPVLQQVSQALRRRWNPLTDEIVFTLDGLPAIDPELGAIAGDAIHNLRSVLDHLADSLVRGFGGVPTKNTYFPVHLTRPKGGVLHISGIDDLPSDVADLLEQVQPYERDVPKHHQLWVLHRLDITDKHSSLLLAVFYARGTTWEGENITITGFNKGPFQDGDEVGRWHVPPTMLDPESFVPTFDFKICLDHPAMVGPHAVRNVATWLRETPLYYVENRVLSRFGPLMP